MDQVNVAAMRVLCSVHGLRPPVKGAHPTAAALVPGSGELALAGPGALLQFFDVVQDRHIDRVQVKYPRLALQDIEWHCCLTTGSCRAPAW